jgi:two-component system chemotaxis response regulator CheY
MNGLDFLIEARKIKTPKHVPILMVTTEGTMAKMEQALEQGADRYVVKPFTAADIERGMDLAALKMAAKP